MKSGISNVLTNGNDSSLVILHFDQVINRVPIAPTYCENQSIRHVKSHEKCGVSTSVHTWFESNAIFALTNDFSERDRHVNKRVSVVTVYNAFHDEQIHVEYTTFYGFSLHSVTEDHRDGTIHNDSDVTNHN